MEVYVVKAVFTSEHNVGCGFCNWMEVYAPIKAILISGLVFYWALSDSFLNCFLFAGRKLLVLECMQTHQNAERTLI